MKNFNKLLKTGIVTFTIALLTITANAQDSKILGGLGINYASNINSVGISAKGAYLVNETWEAAGSFTYLFESEYTKWSMLDFDAHYVFSTDEDFVFYGLSGLNFTFWKYEMSQEYTAYFGDAGLKGTEVGLNFGVGGRYKLTEKLQLVAETKYTVGGFNFFSLGAGVLYNF